jgi:outer membrane receptor protein involved in Fe transport
VAINAPALQLGALYDVEAVNILRGPQGTGLGRNASAGAIKIYSRKPSGEFGGFLRSDFGDYGFMDYEGALEAPIYEDLLSGRFAFRFTQRDGTMENRCGDADPFDQRDKFEGPGGVTVDPPYSICGEPVTLFPGFSEVPPGLAADVNNLDNWAARGTLLFQPTLDMTWLMNFHGSGRDELSRLGQSIGTAGNFCVDGDICSAPPPDDPSLVGEASSGVLGGTQDGTGINTNYMPIEIRQRLFELSPCTEFTNPADPRSCIQQGDAARVQENQAKIQLANELAAELDSEPWAGDFNFTGPTTNETYGGYLRGDIVLPSGAVLTTTTGYDTYDRLIDIDLDFSPETLFHITTDDESWQLYQDLNFSGQFGELRPVRWEAGGWFLREELEASVINDLGDLQGTGVGSREYSQNNWNAAAYLSVYLDLWEKFTLDGGFRYNYDSKDLDMLVLAGFGAGERQQLSDSWQAPSGGVRLTYRFREDTHAYIKYTRGWKPGTFNATVSQNTGVTTADPESIDSYETGLRGSWLEGRLGVDTSIFYYAYENYQIFIAKQFLGGNPEFVILNANDAEVYGAEIDAVARPWYGAFVNVRFSWLESQFLDFVQTDQFLRSAREGGGAIARQTQNSGNQLLNSPRFKVSITAEQTVPLWRYGSLTFRYDGAWTDTTYYDATEGRGIGNRQGEQFLPENTIAQQPYWLHNVRVGWMAPGGRIEIAGWGRNLANTAYKSFAFDGSTFRDTTIYFVGDPRTWGMSMVVNF